MKTSQLVEYKCKVRNVPATYTTIRKKQNMVLLMQMSLRIILMVKKKI